MKIFALNSVNNWIAAHLIAYEVGVGVQFLGSTIVRPNKQIFVYNTDQKDFSRFIGGFQSWEEVI
jgi:hypothetical protein